MRATRHAVFVVPIEFKGCSGEPNTKEAILRCNSSICPLSILLTIALCTGAATADTLRTHGIFSNNMVIQRDKPITIWGWAEPGQKVSVQFGQEKAAATADGNR